MLTEGTAATAARPRLETALLFAAATCLPLGVALAQGAGENLSGNMGYLHVLEARQVLLGRGFGRWHQDVFFPDMFIRPAYTLFVAPLAAAFGDAWVTIRAAAALMQGVLLGVTALAVGACLARAGAVRAARLAPWLVVLHPVLVSQSGALVDTMLFAAAMVGAYAVVATAGPNARRSRWLAAGLVLGLALLTRSTAIAVCPAMALAIGRAVPGARARLAAAGLVTLGAVAVLTPWLVRNHELTGRWMLSTVDGVNLWMGNNENTSRFLDEGRSLDELPGRPRYDSSPMIPVEGQLETSDAARRAAVEFMKAHPGQAALLAVRKAGDLWSVVPTPRTTRSTSYDLKWVISLLWTVPFFAFAALGAVVGWRSRGAVRSFVADALLTCAIFTIPHALAWGGTRLRAPIDPFVAALAAMGAASVLARIRRAG